MRVIVAHLDANVRQLVRIPAFVIPTITFPAMFFVFFTVGRDYPVDIATSMMAGYSTFAVLGVAFFQFGVGIALNRMDPWEHFLRTLPSPAAPRLTAVILAALVFAVVTAGIVIAVALTTTSAVMSSSTFLQWATALFLGSIPFGLLGVAMGYWVHPKGALPVANLLYLPLSYLGGLWMPPDTLPSVLERVSMFLPTRHYVEITWGAVLGTGTPIWSVVILTGFAVAFGLLALWGYRRDEALKYA